MRRQLALAPRLVLGVMFVAMVLVPLVLNRGIKPATAQLPHRPSQSLFIEQVAPLAQELGPIYGVKPSVLLGQAALATNYGSNLVGGRYRNLYSLTATRHMPEVRLVTEQTVAGKTQLSPLSYQVYPTYRASMLDYLERLKNKELGKEKLYQNLLAAKTYKEASTALVLGGYTTDKDYADKLVNVIEKHDLTKYDKK